eukprot:Sspe_Gene.58470::Locus_32070_Transcript_1_1_Confidence_1.000_Length_2258::g.58470::m.58470
MTRGEATTFLGQCEAVREDHERWVCAVAEWSEEERRLVDTLARRIDTDIVSRLKAEVERLRRDRDFLASAFNSLGSARSPLCVRCAKSRESSKKMVEGQPGELLALAREVAGWEDLEWEKREGVVLGMGAVRALKERVGELERYVDSTIREGDAKLQHSSALARSEADRLRAELAKEKQVAQSRLQQLTAERKEVESMKTRLDEANAAIAKLTDEVAALKEAAAEPHPTWEELALAQKAAQKFKAALKRKEAPPPSVSWEGSVSFLRGSHPGLSMLHLASGTGERGEKGESTVIHTTLPKIIVQRSDVAAVAAAAEEEVIDGRLSPLDGDMTVTSMASDENRLQLEAAQAKVEKYQKTIQQLTAENEQLKKSTSSLSPEAIAQHELALQQAEKEKKALVEERAALEAQLADLQAVIENGDGDRTKQMVQVLRRLKEKLDEANAERDATRATLDDVRQKVVLFHERSKKRKQELEERLAEAEAAAAREKELRVSQEEELTILRSDARPRNVWEDREVQTDVTSLLLAALASVEAEEASERLQIFGEALEGVDGVPSGHLPCATSERLVQAPEEGDCPPWMWEEGSPTSQQLEEAEVRMTTISLRFQLDGHPDHTTMLQMRDDCTVADILTRACEQTNERLGTSLLPKSLALYVSMADEKAMAEWLDPDKGGWLHPEEMPPASTLFTPRGRRSDGKKARGYPTEFPYSNRELRTISFFYQHYFDMTEDALRVWFT